MRHKHMEALEVVGTAFITIMAHAEPHPIHVQASDMWSLKGQFLDLERLAEQWVSVESMAI